MAIQKKPPQEPVILYERDIKELTLDNAREILSPEHLKRFEKMMKNVYAEGFLNGQKSMITAVVVFLFTIISFGQSGIVPAGGNAQNISYTIGGALVELQIPIVEDVTLGTPTFELPEPPKQKPAAKKKSFFEKLIYAILNLFNKK